MEYTKRVEGIDFRAKFDLSGKTIVFAGGAGLIGRAFVEAAAQFGAVVVVADLDRNALDDIAGMAAEAHPGRVWVIAADLTDRKAVQAICDFALEKGGRIDGLVNCQQYKGGGFFAPFENYSEADWEAVVATNLKGTFLTCQEIGGWMAANGGGSIVNIPSVYSLVAPNQNLYRGTAMGCPAAYSASKGGVDALSRYLAAYWGHQGVRVNMITPHGVWNEHEPRFEQNFSNFLPLGRMSANHEVAGALVYLLSDASSFVTGHNLVVDGGWTVW